MRGRVTIGFIVLGGILILALLTQLELLTYGLVQGKGQFGIIKNAQPLAEVLMQEQLPDSIRHKLELVDRVKEFAYSELDLDPTDIYSSINMERDKYTMYVVTGSEKFELKPHTWKFPVAGEVPYKGFFDVDMAIDERQKLRDRGLDAGIRIAGGWSTLGWFENPLQIGMLDRTTGDFINLILHEMAHESLYVPGDTELNENLATFIGDEGTLLYLLKNYGEDSEEYIQYVQEESDFQLYAAHFLRGTDLLDSTYLDIANLEVEKKEEVKLSTIGSIIDNLDTVSFYDTARYRNAFSDTLPNNTYFLSFQRYRSSTDQLKREMESFSGLQEYVNFLKTRYGNN